MRALRFRINRICRDNVLSNLHVKLRVGQNEPNLAISMQELEFQTAPLCNRLSMAQ